MNFTVGEVKTSASNVTCIRKNLPELVLHDKCTLNNYLEHFGDTIAELKTTLSDLFPNADYYDWQTFFSGEIVLFELMKAQQFFHLQSICGESVKINLPNGTVKEGKKWISTPMDIAKEISKSLASKNLISQVNEVIWDMSRPLEGDCELKFFTLNSDEGCNTFWHSSAHILD